jgi:hypothetical protein
MFCSSKICQSTGEHAVGATFALRSLKPFSSLMHGALRVTMQTGATILSGALVVLVSASVAALAAVEANAAVTFTQFEIASGDTTSSGIVSGDFNHDGILDLVTINTSSLSFYKGLGHDQYAAPVNQPIAQNLGQVFAADFNGDGKLDLAIAGTPYQTSGVVTILLGNGDGTFTQGTNLTVSGNAASIALADFNGDHKPDIVVSDGVSNMTWVFLGNGDGTFTLSDSAYYGGNTVVAGDFNADGLQDVVFASQDDVGLFLGNGQGGFSNLIMAPLSNVYSLAVGDFYNDRIQTLAALVVIDLGAGSNDAYIYSLRYANNELYVENQNLINEGGEDPPLYVAGGDLNGDFKFDIFLAGGNFRGGPIGAYMLGNGNGTFKPMVNTPSYGDSEFFPFIRDLDLDGRHDVGMAWTSYFNGDGGANVLRNTNASVNCTPPPADTLSVHICAPSNGETIASPYTFRSAGNAFNGIAKRMELWIDGKKVGQDLEDQLKVKATLTAGSHTAAFVVVDSFDNYTSNSVTFTTQ